MLVTGQGKFVGFRSGEKNNKTWMNAFIDDLKNPLSRLQVFVPSDLQADVSKLVVGSTVTVGLNVYMRQTDTYPVQACSLVSIK